MFLEVGDSQGAEIIQSSYVTCLVHLAELCHLISGLEPNSKPRMDNVCDLLLEQLGYLTRGMSANGYTPRCTTWGIFLYYDEAYVKRYDEDLNIPLVFVRRLPL